MYNLIGDISETHFCVQTYYNERGKIRVFWINSEMLKNVNLLIKTNIVARPAGVEPTTFGFGNQHSIQLSYGRIK